MPIQTNTELVAGLEAIAGHFKTVYMWGTFGSPVTENLIKQKTKQYPSWYTPARQAKFRSLIGKGYFGFDCVNVIKGLLWGWNGDQSKSYGGAEYTSRGIPDIDADTMIKKCIGVSTDFRKPMEIGEALWCPGHIGVYIGEGKAIECTPSWSDGVQITAVGNIGTIKGLNTRKWVKHGKIPYIEYVQEDEEMVTKTTIMLNGNPVEVDRILKDDTNYVKLRDMEKLGFKVGYDGQHLTVNTK